MRVKRRRRTQITPTHPDPAEIGPLLRKFGFIGCDTDPLTCRATFDAEGQPRSIKARYNDGWCCRLTLHKSGSYSLTQSVSMTIRAKRPA